MADAIQNASANAPSEGASRFQILALSGGGYRGLYTAKILADFEQHIGASIATRFDLIAGTSIGGILALALALEIPAERIVDLFVHHGDTIFHKRWSAFGWLRAPYTQEPLARLLTQDEWFGQRKLEACRHRVLVPAINYSTGSPVLFKTPHHPNFSRDYRYPLVDVALATSAAPSYFPRHVFDHRQYLDGGLFANAPGLLAVHEARQFLGCSPEQVHVVAIGTMSAKFTVDPRRNRSGGALDWGGVNPLATPKRLFGVAISAQESLVNFMLKQQLPEGRYYHIDDDLTDERARAVALDKADEAAQEVLLGSAAERSKWFLGSPAFRAVLEHAPVQPQFFHGAQAHHQGVNSNAVIT